MRYRIFLILTLCLKDFCTTKAFAIKNEVHEISWQKIGKVFHERYQTQSGQRLDSEIAHTTYLRDSKLKLNPTLSGQWSQNSSTTKLSSRSTRIRQDLPLGLSISGTSTWNENLNGIASPTEAEEVRSLEIKQQLLKDGPWQGITEEHAIELQRELEILKIKIEYDTALARALIALADIHQAQATLSAREKALERAQAQHKSVQDLVQSGYRAKADLLITEANLIRTQTNHEDALRRVAENYQNLCVALFFNCNNEKIEIGEDQEPITWFMQIANLPWPDRTPTEILSAQQAELAAKQVKLAERADLPELSVAVRWSKINSTTANRESQDTRFVELGMQAPIISNIRRYNTTIARLNALRAQADVAQLSRSSLAQKSKATDRLNFTQTRLNAAERLFNLAIQTLQIEQQKYADGNATITEVRRVQEEVERAQLEHITAKRDFIVARIEWAQTVGRLEESMP